MTNQMATAIRAQLVMIRAGGPHPNRPAFVAITMQMVDDAKKN
jgi:hypothetical protein